MKKALLIICFLATAKLMFASDVSMSISNSQVGSTSQDVDVRIHIDYITASVVTGVQLSIIYDPAYLAWKGTPTVPSPGVSFQTNGFTAFGSDYQWNTNFAGNLIMTWIDPEYGFGPNPMIIGNGADLIGYWFTYNGALPMGGTSPISFSLTYQLKDGGYVKVVNEIVDQDFSPCSFVGACGGLCSGSIFYPGGPIGKTWTGLGGDLYWNNPGNWAPPGVPTTEDVTINATKAPMVVITGGPASCGALTVAFGAGVQIDPTGSLTTNGTYDNNGQLIITSDAAGGAGSFISNGALNSTLGTGTFSFQRNMGATFPQEVNNGWHLISSPVAGFNSDAIWDYFAEWYSEPTSQYVHLVGTVPCIPAPTYTMPLGQGWGVKFSTNYGGPPYNCPGGTGTIIEFNGPFTSVYTGNQPLPYTAMGSIDPFHWNLLGNPYPSTIDANLTGWGGSIHTFTGVGYVPWAGGLGFNLIAPTQGFMVNTLVNGIFNVTNAMRTHNGTFQKENIADYVELQVSGNGLSDYGFIRFLEEASPGQDQVWDAPKLMSTVDEMPQIYTTNGDNKFSIDARPAASMVPMSFIAGVTGTYTIEAIETSEFQNVVLEDAVTGQQTDLLTGSYTFNYTGVGEVHPFIVHFTPLGTPELAANSINIWAADHNIYVQAPATTGDIVVYNLMGQEVLRTDIEAGLNVIPMTDVNTYYIVKVIGSDITETGKVFIK